MQISRVAAALVASATFVFGEPDAWLERMADGNRSRVSGDLRQAESEYLSALELARSAGGNSSTRYAHTLNNLAGVYQDLRRHSEAQPILLQAVELLEEAGPPAQRELALALNNLGVSYAESGRLPDAETAHRKAMHISERSGESGRDQLAVALAALGGLYVDGGRLDDGEACLRRALPLASGALGASHSTTIRIALYLGNLHYAKGEYSRAETRWAGALSVIEGSSTQRSHLTAATLRMNLGELKRFERQYDNAERLLRSAIAGFESDGNGPHPLLPTALNHLALTYAEQRRSAEAEILYTRAIAILESGRDSSSDVQRQYAIVLSNFGRLRKQQSAPEQSAALLQRALASAEIGYGPTHPAVKTFLQDYSSMLRALGRKREARDHEERARKMHSDARRTTVDVREISRAETRHSQH